MDILDSKVTFLAFIWGANSLFPAELWFSRTAANALQILIFYCNSFTGKGSKVGHSNLKFLYQEQIKSVFYVQCCWKMNVFERFYFDDL